MRCARDGPADIRRDEREGGAKRMSLRPLSGLGANVADLATIELRRITDVLQVDHVSLFLRDTDDPESSAALIASTGIPLDEALPTHASVVALVVATGRAHHVHHVDGDPRGARSALVSPVFGEQRPIGALLVMTLRESRRFGMFEAQVIGRATEILMARILVPMRRASRPSGSGRFVREAEISHRTGTGQ
jgi:GAF domain-containing protein